MHDNKKRTIWIFHHYATPPTMNGAPRPYNFGINLYKHGYKTRVFAASYLNFSDINLIDDNRLFITNDDTDVPFVFVRTPSSPGNDMKRVINMFTYYKSYLK